MRKVQFLILFVVMFSMGFISDNSTEIEFIYPKDKTAKFFMNTNCFGEFSKEWRKKDYYYLSENNKNGIICSVLFFKLNENEKLMYVDLIRAMFGKEMPQVSPIYPLTYFKTYSNLAKYETNDSIWANPDKEFMSRQVDVKEFNGQKVNQKHMYSYTMFGGDLFVHIHLSKENCSPADSIAMRQILDGLHK